MVSVSYGLILGSQTANGSGMAVGSCGRSVPMRTPKLRQVIYGSATGCNLLLARDSPQASPFEVARWVSVSFGRDYVPGEM